MSSRRQLLNDAAARLTLAGASDAALDAGWMLAHVLGQPRLLMLAGLEAQVEEQAAACFAALVDRREKGEPLQYVLGEADFMGHTFRVDARVLVPRPDTETLCEAAIARMKPGMQVLDIGTGSGALAVSMALAIPDARVTAVDISPDALAVACENGARLGAHVSWVQGDLFSALDGQRFDVIVSNPPYIPTGELAQLQWEVRSEPKLALDGGADGLDFYRRIVDGLATHLNPGGALLLEVGDGQAADVAALLDGRFSHIEILRDLAGLERTVIGDVYAG